MAESAVELGFVEKSTSWKLRSKFFPSKIGGFPSWLGLNNIPDSTDLLCKTCQQPLQFLLQVYAPITDYESAFHRTIFVFLCPKEACSKMGAGSSFVVLRSQLPRKNDFYSFDPPDFAEKSSSDPSADKYQPLCDVCGYKASMKCQQCSERNYCSEYHQMVDLENVHKLACGKEKEGNKKQKKHKNPCLIQEFELVTETEDLPTIPEKSDEQKMKEYHQFMKSDNAPKEMQNVPMDDLDNMMQKNDKAFNKFKKRVDFEPEQVLRYQRDGMPLWVSAENVPSLNEIPNCTCGAKRIFEFQIMPQLLNHLGLDSVESIDWGTLAVYTCSKSCDAGIEKYVEEFLWKQDFSGDLR